MLKLIVLGFSFIAATSVAADLDKTRISEKLQSISAQTGNKITVNDIEQSPIPEFYQVITDKGILYAQKEGDYIFSGSLHDFQPGMNNLTVTRMSLEHKKKIDALRDDFITYKATNEEHEVMVFFDTSCGYCHKLHSEIAQYNALGITIHYAAYPRNGVMDQRRPTQPTQAYQELQNIWCASDDQKNFVFDMVIRGTEVPRKECTNTIADQYALGRSIGIAGTPSIYSLDGSQVAGGYVPPQALKAMLSKGRS